MQDNGPWFMEIADHTNWFERYVETKIKACKGDPAPLKLKLEHTFNVLENARQIAASEQLAPDLERAANLAALYHDLSRFDQYLIYGTFKDKDSRNHGAWSVKILKNESRLQEESARIRRLVQVAIGVHNRRETPPTITGESRIICNLTRDADKLDIMAVMDRHLSAQKPYNPTVILGLPDDPHLAGPAVIKAALAGESASYDDLRSVNDYRLLLGTWLFSMNFGSSRSLCRKAGHAARLVESLPDNQIYGKVRAKLLSLLR